MICSKFSYYLFRGSKKLRIFLKNISKTIHAFVALAIKRKFYKVVMLKEKYGIPKITNTEDRTRDLLRVKQTS
jgi:hypothetical protein